MPTTPKQAATRRRDVGTLLVLCTLVALAGTLATGSLLTLTAFALLFAGSSAYVMLALRRRRAAPTAVVHYLPLRDPATASTITMVRRTVNE
ncbi:hypothetical protein [Candidatus Poriferisodalis sp.]|uniref:hypothetical protein n=1 Tax=Candidatus Poriferisodalis sp. TaxID=3101277 RepID=UPI003B027550